VTNIVKQNSRDVQRNAQFTPYAKSLPLVSRHIPIPGIPLAMAICVEKTKQTARQTNQRKSGGKNMETITRGEMIDELKRQISIRESSGVKRNSSKGYGNYTRLKAKRRQLQMLQQGETPSQRIVSGLFGKGCQFIEDKENE
jgi:hypothetical protein